MSKLLLLSGGVDSICLAVWKRPELCITLDYGQAAADAEIAAAKSVSKELDIEHSSYSLPLDSFGSGIMSQTGRVSQSKHPEFWPFRNQFLITIGAMCAARYQLNSVIIGTVVSDQRHVDGTGEFIDRMSSLLRMQEGGILLEAPAKHLTSIELVRASGISFDVLGWAHSCHRSSIACGSCPGCSKHSQTMGLLGLNR